MPAQCVNAPAEYDNMATSLKVSRTDTIAPAYGHWIGFTGTESVSFQLHQGFTSTNEYETDLTQQFELSIEMQMGFNYGVESGKEKISLSYAEEIEYDTKTAYSMDIDKTVEVDCTAQGDTAGVGLY